MVRHGLRRLRSRRLAVLLMVVVAVLLLSGVLIPQQSDMPPIAFDAVKADKPYVAVAWRLGLTNIYKSPALNTAMTMLILNLILNLEERVRALPGQMRIRATTPKPRSVARSPIYRRVELPDGAQALAVTTRIARSHRFTVVETGEGFRAVRGQWAPIASVLFHLSISLVAFGALASFATRFHGVFTLAEGQQFDGTHRAYVETNPQFVHDDVLPSLDLTNTGMNLDYGEHDHVLDAWIDLRTPDGIEHRVRVNYPYRQGITVVRLADYGLAPTLVVEDLETGKSDEWVLKGKILPPGREDAFRLPGFGAVTMKLSDEMPDGSRTTGHDVRNGTLTVHIPGQEDDIEGTLRIGEGRITRGKHALSLAKLAYFGQLEVDRDHGKPIVFLGFILGLIGMTWRLGYPMRWLLGVVETLPDGSRVLHLGGRSDYTRQPYGEQFEAMVDTIEEELRR